jgi:hypothetical protein
LSHNPAGDYPKRTYCDEKDGTGINCHQCLENESCVEGDVIKGTDRSRGCVCKQFANKSTTFLAILLIGQDISMYTGDILVLFNSKEILRFKYLIEIL